MNPNLEKGAPHRFKPGVSGNPGGRPKKRPISERYEELAELELPEKERIKHGLPEGATYEDALAMVRFKAALDGKPDAAREIREAIEGKTGPRQETINRGPVEIAVVFEDPVPPSRRLLRLVHAGQPHRDSDRNLTGAIRSRVRWVSLDVRSGECRILSGHPSALVAVEQGTAEAIWAAGRNAASLRHRKRLRDVMQSNSAAVTSRSS